MDKQQQISAKGPVSKWKCAMRCDVTQKMKLTWKERKRAKRWEKKTKMRMLDTSWGGDGDSHRRVE